MAEWIAHHQGVPPVAGGGRYRVLPTNSPEAELLPPVPLVAAEPPSPASASAAAPAASAPDTPETTASSDSDDDGAADGGRGAGGEGAGGEGAGGDDERPQVSTVGGFVIAAYNDC